MGLMVGPFAAWDAPTSPPPNSGETFVDATNGVDTNPGTEGMPIKTIAAVNALTLTAGDTVYFKRGESWDETLTISNSGSSGSPITITKYGTSGGDPVIDQTQADGDWITYDGIDFDGGGSGHSTSSERLVRIRGNNCVVQNCEVHNAAVDGIDIRGGATPTTIDNCDIHTLLRGTYASQSDAHGIGVRTGDNNTVDVTINNCRIRQVSGDCFQTNPNRDQGGGGETGFTVNVTITNSDLYTEALTETFDAGNWDIGDIPGENAFDSKANDNNSDLITATFTNVKCWGFTDRSGVSDYSTSAAIFVKEHCDLTMDRFLIYDCQYAFRTYGDEGNGNPDIILKNGVTYDCDAAFNINTTVALENLKIYNCTFGSNITTLFQEQSAGNNAASSDIKNNVSVAAVPSDWSDASNIQAATSLFNDDTGRDYRPKSTSSTIVDEGVDLLVPEGVTVDYEGISRDATPNIGAYETSVNPPGGGDDTYYDLITAGAGPANGTVDTFEPFKVEARIDQLSGGAKAWDYDATEDAAVSDIDAIGGSAGLASSEKISIDPGRGGNITRVTSGIQVYYWEHKFLGTLQQWKDWAGATSSLDWKHFRVEDSQGSGGGRMEELRSRFTNSVAADKIAHHNWRFYPEGAGGGTAPGGNNIELNTDFDTDVAVWTYYWLERDIDGDRTRMWIGDENRSPALVWDSDTSTEPEAPHTQVSASDTFELVTASSTESAASNQNCQLAFRNFIVLKDVTDTQAIVDQF